MAILNAKCEERGVRFAAGRDRGARRGSSSATCASCRARSTASSRHQTLGGEQVDADAGARRCSATSPSQRRAPTPPRRRAASFTSFLTDIAIAVAQHVEQWKTRLTEAIAYWSGEGYRTAPLERVLQAPTPPTSVEALLRELRGERVEAPRPRAADRRGSIAALGGARAFRDPDRVAEAEQLLERALAGVVAAAGTVGGVHARRLRGRARATSSPCAPPTRSSPCPGSALQPALHPRPERRRQDAPAERDRQRARRRRRGGAASSRACRRSCSSTS